MGLARSYTGEREAASLDSDPCNVAAVGDVLESGGGLTTTSLTMSAIAEEGVHTDVESAPTTSLPVPPVEDMPADDTMATSAEGRAQLQAAVATQLQAAVARKQSMNSASSYSSSPRQQQQQIFRPSLSRKLSGRSSAASEAVVIGPWKLLSEQ
jgi:hypothetical protein